MSMVDGVILRHLDVFNRDTLLPLILDNHPLLSGPWFKQKWCGALLFCLSNKALFTLIYKKNLWGIQESVSGAGSTVDATLHVRTALPDLLRHYQIGAILDIPCGDFNWMKHVELGNVRYTGADIVQSLVEANAERFGNSRRKYVCLDLVNDPLPEAELILCRDGLVHLPDRDVKKALLNIARSRAVFLLTTTFPDQKENKRIGKDYWRPINLEKDPFNLPPPIMLIREGLQDQGGRDKSLGLWRIKDIC